jgi:hypothetical protein
MKKIVLFLMLILSVVNCKTAPPPPPPAPAEMGPKMIFFDNFNTHKSEWQQISGIWQWDPNGFLLQRTADPRQINCLLYVQNPQISDATIETMIRIKTDLPSYLTATEQDKQLVYNVRYLIGAGIIFRMQDKDNYYMFRLAGEEGAVLGKMVGGEWIDLANPRTADFLTGERVRFAESNWYRLKVEVYGSRIVCSINDVPVINKTDDTYGLGKFGLVTFKTFGDFDYVKVYNKTESEVKNQ